MSAIPEYYTPQVHANGGLALVDLVKWLIGDHDTLVGPGWTIVEAYDGTLRETPSGAGISLAELGAGNNWRVGVIPLNSWIVLESGVSLVSGNSFQIYIEYDTTTNADIYLLPLADFATGGGAQSPPTLPTKIGTSDTTPHSFGFQASGATYLGIADETMLSFVYDNTTVLEWLYVGEVDGARAADVRPFVINSDGAAVFLDLNGANFRRISPVDDTTDLSGVPEGFGLTRCDTGDDSFLNAYGAYPVGVNFTTAGHTHNVGWLRHLRCVDRNVGSRGTLGNLAWAHFNNSVSGAGFAMAWDGATAYP